MVIAHLLVESIALAADGFKVERGMVPLLSVEHRRAAGDAVLVRELRRVAFACIEGSFFGAMPRGVPPPPGRLFNWRGDDSSVSSTKRSDCRGCATIRNSPGRTKS